MRSLAIAIVCAFTLSLAHAAAPSSASDAIRAANTRVRQLLAQADSGGADKKVASRMTTELRGLFDIGDLAKRALVDHWAKMSAAQRSELVDTLRLIVERNYISQLKTNLEYEIQYVGEEKQGTDVVVKTLIKAKRNGRPIEIPVDYVLHEDGGAWRAYDVITDEVSLLKNYRSQFNRIIAKDGTAGLIRRMKERLDRNED
jgi:phospholipid transport system substrate-binding protein